MCSDPDCRSVREAVSAEHDDERTGLTRSEVAVHLDICVPCARFADRITTLSRQTRIGAVEPVRDLSAVIVKQAAATGQVAAAGKRAARGANEASNHPAPQPPGSDAASGRPARPTDRETAHGPRERNRIPEVRALVALAGIVQLVLALPTLLGLVGPDLHIGRDLGALQVALGVGLVFAAAQPRRAQGLLPVAAVVASVTVVAAGMDVATGAATLAAELTHLAEVVGVVALWALTRHAPAAASPALRPARAQSW